MIISAFFDKWLRRPFLVFSLAGEGCRNYGRALALATRGKVLPLLVSSVISAEASSRSVASQEDQWLGGSSICCDWFVLAEILQNHLWQV